jgi:dethiobiotin synthetase
MAAAALGRRPFVLADLLAAMSLPRAGRWIVESVGGVRSPLAEDADTVRLAEALAPRRIIFVVGSGLGAVNAVLLARDALRRWPFTVFLNRFQPELDVHTRTAAWLAGRERISVATTIEALAVACWPEAWPPREVRS